MSKNFIHRNIQNIKGARQPPSTMQDDFKRRLSVPKPSTTKRYPNVVSHYKQPTISNRVDEMEKKIEQIQNNRAQSLIISHISEIKDDIRMIKSHLFQMKRSTVWNDDRQRTMSSGGGEEGENVGNVGSGSSNHRMKSQGSENGFKHNNSSKVTFVKSEHSQQQQQNNKPNSTIHHPHPTLQQLLILHQKHSLTRTQGLPIKTIYAMLKQYKLQGPQFGSLFYGYSKRNNQPVAIKHISQVQQANLIIEVYDKLWKNIAKAKWTCVNRVYDYRLEEENFVVFEKNKSSIANLPAKPVILDIFKSLEFIHECGYLYRNISPEHFMLNDQGQLVVVDFKRARRYIDVKGHFLEVTDQSSSTLSVFASNNQVRGLQQGRKDDLEALGYFALLLMGYDIPWYGLNKELTVKVRATLTLQELFKGHKGWIEFMATVMRLGKNDRPDYRRLQGILEGV